MDETSKQYIEQEVQKHQLIIVANGFDTTQITTAIIALAEAFEVVFETISENLRPLAQWLEEYGLSFDQYNLFLSQTEFAEEKAKRHKIDFTRPVIRHQVISRKPKHLIKKIIH